MTRLDLGLMWGFIFEIGDVGWILPESLRNQITNYKTKQGFNVYNILLPPNGSRFTIYVVYLCSRYRESKSNMWIQIKEINKSIALAKIKPFTNILKGEQFSLALARGQSLIE